MESSITVPEIDRISDLPEVLICQIFSFLPIKETVQSSLLSSRWRYLWTRVSHLDFDEEQFDVIVRDTIEEEADSVVKYVNFISKVFTHHDIGSSLEKFRIVYKISSATLEPSSNIGNWITCSVMRNVRQLHVDTHPYFDMTPLEFPHCLFNCKSLTELKIKLSATSVVFPKSINLPKLKIMHLHKVIFVDTQNNSRHSCVNFPCLEDLVFEECNWYLLDSLDIYAPMLKSLYITTFSHHSYSQDYDKCKIINISAPSLKSLTCIGLVPHDYSLKHDLSSDLAKARFHLDENWKDFNYICQVSTFFNTAARNVKKLMLYDRTMKLLRSQCLLDNLPILCNLKHLLLETSDTEGAIDIIFHLLFHSPVLESLTINFGGDCTPSVLLQKYPDCKSCSGSEEKLMPPFEYCAFNCLKVVEFSNLKVSRSQFHFMKCILENAWALERMKMTLFAMDNSQMLLLKQLSKSPRVGKSCEAKSCVELFIFDDKLKLQETGLEAGRVI